MQKHEKKNAEAWKEKCGSMKTEMQKHKKEMQKHKDEKM